MLELEDLKIQFEQAEEEINIDKSKLKKKEEQLEELRALTTGL